MPEKTSPEMRTFEVSIVNRAHIVHAAYYGPNASGDMYEFKDSDHKIVFTVPMTGLTYIRTCPRKPRVALFNEILGTQVEVHFDNVRSFIGNYSTWDLDPITKQLTLTFDPITPAPYRPDIVNLSGVYTGQ